MKGIIITTNVIDNIKITRSALESSLYQLNEYYLPIGSEHDIRLPPRGRVISAEIVKLDNGEYGVEATVELFESSDTESELKGDGRVVKINDEDVETFSIHSDEILRSEKHKEIIGELSEFASNIFPIEKRSIDPISTLVIYGGILALGLIGEGFFSKLGEDIYDKLKNSLVKYYKKTDSEEEILDLYFTIQEDEMFEVHVIVNTSGKNLNGFFDSKFEGLDELLASYYNIKSEISKIVVEYKDGNYKILYLVRKDGVPLMPVINHTNE